MGRDGPKDAVRGCLPLEVGRVAVKSQSNRLIASPENQRLSCLRPSQGRSSGASSRSSSEPSIRTRLPAAADPVDGGVDDPQAHARPLGGHHQEAGGFKLRLLGRIRREWSPVRWLEHDFNACGRYPSPIYQRPVCQPSCSGQNSRTVLSISFGAVSIDLGTVAFSACERIVVARLSMEMK